MTAYKETTKENLIQFLQSLAKEHTLIAPVEEDGIISFKQVTDANEIKSEYQNSLVPPKSWFFPQSERLFTFRCTQGKYELFEPSLPSGAVLFGVRPCDLKAILALDPVFYGKYKDLHYSNKRENTILIGLACSSIERHCFCYAIGDSPTDSQGADIFITLAGNRYMVEILTIKGTELVSRYTQYFTEDKIEQEILQKKQDQTAQLLEQRKPYDLKKVKRFLDNHFELPYWEELAYRCLGCGICTYLCPTCHCFDVCDYTKEGSDGERIRCWDSCQFKDFNLIAGGYNPRPTKKERLRNRFLHKFKYHEDRYGLFGCVGCGRCVRKCPVNIDPRKIILDLQEVTEDE